MGSGSAVEDGGRVVRIQVGESRRRRCGWSGVGGELSWGNERRILLRSLRLTTCFLYSQTVGNDTFQDWEFYGVGSLPDVWLDSSMIFNVTVFVPPRSYARRLELSSTAAGSTTFKDLRNATFDNVDVRLALGYIGTDYLVSS